MGIGYPELLVLLIIVAVCCFAIWAFRKARRSTAPVQSQQKPGGEVPESFAASMAPGVVRVYGMIFIVSSIFGMVVGALAVLLALMQPIRPEWRWAQLVGALVILGVQVGWFFIGKGLRMGKRQAVYGLCVVGGLLAGLALVVMAMGATPAGPTPASIVALLAIGIFFVPPIVSAFRHWTALR